MCVVYKCGGLGCTWMTGCWHPDVCEEYLENIEVRYVNCGCVVRFDLEPHRLYSLQACSWMDLMCVDQLWCSEQLTLCENPDCEATLYPDELQCQLCYSVQPSAIRNKQ